MKTIQYDISNIDERDIGIFTDMLTYISEYIYGIQKEAQQVQLEIEDDKEKEVLEKIQELRSHLMLDELRKGKDATTKVLEDYRDYVPINESSPFDALIEQGSIVEMTEGVFGYSGLFLQVFRYFNQKIEEFGRETFADIIEFEDSVLFPVIEYERGLYFESFPHHFCFETTMKNDLSLLDRFSKYGVKDPEIFTISNFKRPLNLLRHAACAPIYPMLENRLIKKEKPLYYMVSGKCFRNEDKNVMELSRLNEFYMKEYVCIGTMDQTIQFIEKAKDLWHFWIKTFGLKCTVETANDSFFASNYKKLKIFQLMGNSKQELRVDIPHQQNQCAVSSANMHRTHFTKTYNIHSEDALCSSACFAFGIERLSYALLCQKGTDVSQWDEATRKEIFG